ncbi:FAD-dependent oxidoreductase [Prauserella muralis]|uniref:FAD-dependent oxidoreductase n=1 Tax=Prauserella muralis TaxID=588067 RepID=UPI000DD3629C
MIPPPPPRPRHRRQQRLNPRPGPIRQLTPTNHGQDQTPSAARSFTGHALAGSDYARGWAGFIDGAIESGLRAARQITNELESEN